MHTLILGLDAFDPDVFERLSAQGRLPNLTRYADQHKYARFSVSNPPQSEVSWTSIATGLDAGGHGIFDFVHRDPASYGLSVSLLPTKRSLFGTEFAPPFTCTTLFDYAAEKGYPAASLWWPATFPARPQSPVQTIPGLGTPDIHGRLGVGTLFLNDKDLIAQGHKTAVELLTRNGKGRYSARLKGPARQSRNSISESGLELRLEVMDDSRAHLRVGQQSLELRIGKWSPILELTFKLGWFTRVRVLTRAILTQIEPDPRLYFLPLQLHPLHTPWRYGTPYSFVKQLWKSCGPFLSIGWPQDTTGLEDGCINDEEFLALCESIFAGRERILIHRLQRFGEGVLGAVFDTLDRVQHMFWRDRPEIVESWYEKCDTLVGRVEEQVTKSGYRRLRTIIVSDHGFSNFEYKVHLNHWLAERGYLAAEDERKDQSLDSVIWSQTSAYALGLNSLYLNLADREGQGCIAPEQVGPLIDRVCRELRDWSGPDGKPVVHTILRRDDVFNGPYAAYGPDLVIGYSPGYRGSSQTGLGQWEANSIEANRDHWGADHCIAAETVPGVIMASENLSNFPRPSFRDIPPLAVEATPKVDDNAAPPPAMSDEDQKTVSERLKSLGYL